MTPSQPWRCPPLTAGSPVASITARQADVLAGICHGHRNKQIAERLCVSEETVKTLTKQVYAALGARGRSHAAALACSGQVTVHVRGDYRRAERRAA